MERRNAAQKDIQLTAHAMAHRSLYGEEEGGVRLDVMVRTKQPKVQKLEASRTEEDIQRFLRLLQQVDRGIRNEVFYPSENYMCGICGYEEMCRQW